MIIHMKKRIAQSFRILRSSSSQVVKIYEPKITDLTQTLLMG